MINPSKGGSGLIIRGADTSINSSGQELVGHGTATFPLGCYEESVSDRPVAWHWHDDWEIILAIQGMVKVRTATGDHLLQPGEAVYLGGSCVHEVVGDGPGAVLRSAVFHPRFISGMDTAIWQRYLQPFKGIEAVLLVPQIPWQAECIRLFENCWNALDQEDPGYEIRTREALTSFAFLLYTRLDVRQCRPSAREMRNSQRIKKMLQFIQDHYGENITISQIAASALLSESECLRCFRCTVNATPSQYLRDYRLQICARMLILTNEKIGDIGVACGFSDAAYFTKLFREAMGCTPSEYRRKKGVRAAGGSEMLFRV